MGCHYKESFNREGGNDEEVEDGGSCISDAPKLHATPIGLLKENKQ